jgi:hypothetical protein
MLSKKRQLIALVLIAIFATAGALYYAYLYHNPFTYYDDEVHVHADFIIVVNDEKLNLTADEYQSSIKQVLHKNVHLHDGDDHVVHRHADGITFAEFLSSLGFTLNNECLTDDNDVKYCTDTENVLTLYVNKTPITLATEYIPQEEDQILLYYGRRDNDKLGEYLDSITDESCIYSGTCRERGTAPAESCGLTCEI